MTRVEYLLAELRCASLRARLWQADIESIGLALKAGWITPEQAVETLADCHCLQLIEPKGGRVPTTWSEPHGGRVPTN